MPALVRTISIYRHLADSFRALCDSYYYYVITIAHITLLLFGSIILERF